MRDEAWKTLFHPFEAGRIELPAASAPALFLDARPGFAVPEGFAAPLELVQGFRPDFLELEKAGHRVRPEPGEARFELALVLAGRHRGRGEYRIAQAIARCGPNGLVVVAGANREGADSLRRRVGALVELESHLPKHRGTVFWFRVPSDPAPLLAALTPAPALVEGRFRTAPGMFSHGRVDPASRLLASFLPTGLGGRIADFGAGWGYLAAAVAERSAGLECLHLFEADFESCQAARANLADVAANTEVSVFWRDLASEPADAAPYDAIVMNPPFHASGRAADPGIGLALIAAAARSLRKGGRLFMVANAPLPYEAALAAGFARSGELGREGGFKVMSAVR